MRRAHLPTYDQTCEFFKKYRLQDWASQTKQLDSN
jgi:hypothetical protein